VSQAPVQLLACAAAALWLLGGCSAGPSTGTGTRLLLPESSVATQSGHSRSGERFAAVALDDGQLGAIRGGFDAGPGAELRFSFQAATYLNGSPAQTVVMPTITLMGTVSGGGFVPSSATSSPTTPIPLPAPGAGLPSTGSPVAVLSAGTISRPNLGVPFGAVGTPNFSWVNLGSASAQGGSVTPATASLGSGATSIVTTLGGGLTNVIGNTANGQLVQQVSRVDISTMGLSGVLQGVRSPVLDNLRNTQFLPR